MGDKIYVLTRGAYEGEWEPVGVFSTPELAMAYADEHGGNGDWSEEAEMYLGWPRGTAHGWGCNALPTARLFGSYIVEEHRLNDPSLVLGNDDDLLMDEKEIAEWAHDSERSAEQQAEPCVNEQCRHLQAAHHWDWARVCSEDGCTCFHVSSIGPQSYQELRRELSVARLAMENHRRAEIPHRTDVVLSRELGFVLDMYHSGMGHADDVHRCSDGVCMEAHTALKVQPSSPCEGCLADEETWRKAYQKFGQLMPADKEAIRHEYLTTKVTQLELAEKYELLPYHIQKLVKGLAAQRRKAVIDPSSAEQAMPV